MTQSVLTAPGNCSIKEKNMYMCFFFYTDTNLKSWKYSNNAPFTLLIGQNKYNFKRSSCHRHTTAITSVVHVVPLRS